MLWRLLRVTLRGHLILLWISWHRLLRIPLLWIILGGHLVRIGLPGMHLLGRISILRLRRVTSLLGCLLVCLLCLTLLFSRQNLRISFLNSRGGRCLRSGGGFWFSRSGSIFFRCVHGNVKNGIGAGQNITAGGSWRSGFCFVGSRIRCM